MLKLRKIFDGEYEVQTIAGSILGYVRKCPHRRHLSASKVGWQVKKKDDTMWSGAFESRKQACVYVWGRY